MKKLLLFLIPLILTSCTELQVKQNNSVQQIGTASADWEFYPNPLKKIVNPNEEVTFKISPKSNNLKLTEMVVNFGDGISNTITLKSHKDKNNVIYPPIYLTHSYKKDGIYLPSAVLKNSSMDKAPSISKTEIIIAPKIKTEQELKDLAFQDAVNQIESGIKKILRKRKYSRPKFSLSVLNNANFEYYPESKEVQVIKKLTESLVKRGYTILEKSPQALIRLAHESVVKENKRGSLSDNYLDYLEYGLRTQYAGSQTPFIYGIQIEGVDDRIENIEESNTSNVTSAKDKLTSKLKNRFSKKNQKENETITNTTDKKQIHSSTVRNRPLLYAKFSTANYLIVIDLKEKMQLTKSEPIYFNTKYKTQAIERKAYIKFNVRILNRDGSIAWITDVCGVKTDKIIPDFSNEKTKNLHNFSKFFKFK